MSEARALLASRQGLRPLQIAIATVVLASVAALGYLGWHLDGQMRETRDRWAEFDTAQAASNTQIDAVSGALGYNGFIHNFKNYVLRGRDANRNRAIADYDRANAALAEMSEAPLLADDERAAIATVRTTLDRYRAALDTATALHAAGATPQEIDPQVTISDDAAVKALQLLQARYVAREAEFRDRFQDQLLDNARLVQSGAPALVLLLVLGVLGYTLVQRLLRALNGLESEVLLRRDAEAELRVKSAKLEATNQELEQFAYVASHDLRAPLRGIETLAGWLEDDLGEKLEGDNKEHLTMLRGRIARLDKLLQDLLAYSRSGRDLNEIKDPVDTRAVINEELELMDAPADVTLAVTGDWPTLLLARPPFAQVMRNLVSNAIKHRGGQGIEITVNAAPDPHDGFTCFSVTDTGPGIPADFQERVFGMFQTLKSRDQVEGSGMGLAMVRKIVIAAGGTVTLTSPPAGQDTGTRFDVRWPNAPQTDNTKMEPQ